MVDETHKAYVRALEDFKARALKVLEYVQWSGDFCDEPGCPACWNPPHRGHDDECGLGSLLKEAGK